METAAAALALLNLAVLAALFLRVGRKTPEAGERMEGTLRAEMAQNRKEVGDALKNFNDSMLQRFDSLVTSTEGKLDQMRATVDKELHQTLERRLGESFKAVSERLAEVNRGLGEMQALATGVGDLKKVLSNVKTLGVLGEVQLRALIEQMLAPDQYAENVATKSGSKDCVEFAIKLPTDDPAKSTLFPVDSKFPLEYYHRYVDACHRGDAADIEAAGKELAARIRQEAKKINDKYLDPPHTTEFAVMFLPFESLYADVLRMNLLEKLHQDFRVTIAGPTTFCALLNSVRMLFRAKAIESRSAEVLTLLGVIAAEFGKFGIILAKTQERLNQAASEIDTAQKKTKTIERQLRKVQELPGATPAVPPAAEELEVPFEKEKIV